MDRTVIDASPATHTLEAPPIATANPQAEELQSLPFYLTRLSRMDS